MRNLIGGLNTWAIAFLGLAFWLGHLRHPFHIHWAIFAAVFATFSQAVIFALFMGSAKLIKKHIGRFNLPESFLRRLNRLYFRLFPWAMIGSATFPLVGILGGAAQFGTIPLAVHFWAASLGTMVLLIALPFELRVLHANHRLIRDVEAALPDLREIPMVEIEPAPGYQDDRQIDLNRRKIAAACSIFGWAAFVPPASYAFIRWEMPDGWLWLFLFAGIGLVGCGRWLRRRS